ncbi:peptide ABC transporter substrate-binding protein [Opitutaceae bacterium TAV4]|nr:peptide ABC transporter substrate-binding protein [Opitutaceae bacterium TAV4]RRJ98487.1 peptide ABC transporter substrate-binding protein [Opitutaceae bacterium TAV3]
MLNVLRPHTCRTPMPFPPLLIRAFAFAFSIAAAAATLVAAPKSKILHFGNGTEPQDIDPAVTTGVPEARIINALFEGLVSYAPSGSGVAPGVASRWETSADGLEWTFHLRPDARWSDGAPVTAHDFVRSFQRTLSPSFGSEYAYFLYHVSGAEDFNKGVLKDFARTGFSAPDDRTLRVRLRQRVPFLLDSLTHHAWMPVPIATLEKHGGLTAKGTAWTRPANFVGNGPFVLGEWLPNQKIVVTRSLTYWNAAATRLDAIHFHAIDNADTEERQYRAGKLDITSTLPTSRIRAYRRQRPAEFRSDDLYGLYLYRLNLTRKPLDDVRVRRALALAIDRSAITENILLAGQQPALNFIPPSPEFHSTASIAKTTTPAAAPLDAARRLLAEAGFPDGRGFPRLELLYNSMESHKQLAEAIQQMWKRNLGIDIVLRNEEWKVYLETVNRLDYDIARFGWNGDYPDPYSFLDLWITGGGNNNTGYANPAYDRLLADALAAPATAARHAVYQKLDDILTRDAPGIPLYFYKRVYAISPRVRHWMPNVLDMRAWQYVDLAEP